MLDYSQIVSLETLCVRFCWMPPLWIGGEDTRNDEAQQMVNFLSSISSPHLREISLRLELGVDPRQLVSQLRHFHVDWIDHIAKNIIPSNMRVIMSQDPEKQRAALEENIAALRTFTAQIKGPYFLGDEFSLADVAIAPWIMRDYVLSEHRGYSREAVSPKWKAYCEAIEQRPSVSNTFSVSHISAAISFVF